jgi:pimeloyl-ACP methyl ester carboxylesterase
MTPQEPIPHWPGELITLDGGHQVYVRSTPEGPEKTGEPALFVHGLAGSSRNWTDLIDLLRPRLACEALDLPGFGDSPPRPDRRYSIAALAQTVEALIESRKDSKDSKDSKDKVHLIASSLGGAVAVKLAATRPDLIKTLTLISPALPDPRPHLDQVHFAVISLPGVGPRVLRKYDALPPRSRVADVIATCFADPARFPAERFAAEVAELARRDTLDHATAALIGTIRTLTADFFRKGRHTAWRDAARITAPTLVIYGSQDRVVDPRQAGRAARAFANSKIVVLPRTGHLAHMEHPVQVAAEITAMLDAAVVKTREFPLTPAG